MRRAASLCRSRQPELLRGVRYVSQVRSAGSMSASALHAQSEDTRRLDVSQYYGKILSSSQDLQTNACTTEGIPRHVKDALANVHEEVLAKYYGCGLTIPTTLEGMRVLDLGSGSGRDCYVLSQLVGPKGYVVGVDMTDEQLAVARRHQQWHAAKFGHATPNTDFKKGYIEKLDELGLEDNSFDIVVSNCVINLSPDKDKVLREVHRVLKPGGELYFSDVYADRRVPEHLRQNKVLWGECISGALYVNDFIAMSKRHGFFDPRLVEDRRITINNPKLEPLVAHINFYSATYRLWKLDEALLEPECEDYGQAVIYKGTIPEMPNTFILDQDHRLDAGRIFPVCGNSYNMLYHTRLRPHFDFIGNFSRHYGPFPCGTHLAGAVPFASSQPTSLEKAGPSSSCC